MSGTVYWPGGNRFAEWYYRTVMVIWKRVYFPTWGCLLVWYVTLGRTGELCFAERRYSIFIPATIMEVKRPSPIWIWEVWVKQSNVYCMSQMVRGWWMLWNHQITTQWIVFYTMFWMCNKSLVYQIRVLKGNGKRLGASQHNEKWFVYFIGCMTGLSVIKKIMEWAFEMEKNITKWVLC